MAMYPLAKKAECEIGFRLLFIEKLLRLSQNKLDEVFKLQEVILWFEEEYIMLFSPRMKCTEISL